MATNSKREQILLALISKVEDLSSINQVQRVQPNKLDDLRRYSSQQLPLVVIIGGVPVPVEHISGRVKGGVDVVVSDLRVQFFVYFQDNVNPDSTLSSLMDDLWALLYTDQTVNGLAIGLEITPEVQTAAWEPYAAFSLNVAVRYKHTIGGI